MKKTDHLKMLYDIGELSHLFTDTENLDSFLQKIVEMVSHHMHTDVCSVYLYDVATNTLAIQANIGLNPERYKEVKMKVGEGLVGRCFKELQPVCVRQASKSPGFKFFPGLFEENYDSFLAVPIYQGVNRIGVLVVQRKIQYPFHDRDLSSLQVLASQLGTIISQVRLLITLKEQPSRQVRARVSKQLKVIKGKAASGGFASFRSRVFRKEETFVSLLQRKPDRLYTMEEFKRAVHMTEAHLEELQKKVEEKLSDVASLIFTAHLLMLKDEKFIGSMVKLIKDGVNPPEAIVQVGKKYMDIFSASPSPLIREKKQDLEDLVTHLFNSLLLKNKASRHYQSHIIIARELYPSDILKMDSQNVKGIILISGGVTSHVAILSRSLQIPVVIVDMPELLDVPDETEILLDGDGGTIYINPTRETVQEFKKQKMIYDHIMYDRDLLEKPAVCADGTRIGLMVNINLLSDMPFAREYHADGIGLYRTEFPFLIRPDFPSEEEQYVIYRKLVDGMPGKPITFRTLDIGGDKLLSYYDMKEQNPFLGFRSIRFSLQHKEVFVQQIRAILRAGATADLRIMFPMISSIDEFLKVKEIVHACRKELKKERIGHHPNPRLGIMVEIPSIIDILDEVAREVEFFSIGTNDLIQFVLAVDRTNEKVAGFYNPLHPSILRTLKKIVDVAGRHSLEVCLCGDAAHNEKLLPFLVGIGLRNLSINPLYIPRMKKALLELEVQQAQAVAEKLLTKSKVCDTERILAQFFRRKRPAA